METILGSILLIFFPIFLILGNKIFFTTLYLAFILALILLFLLIKEKKGKKIVLAIACSLFGFSLIIFYLLPSSKISIDSNVLKKPLNITRVTHNMNETYNPYKRAIQYFGAAGETGCQAYPLAWSDDSKKLVYEQKCKDDFLNFFSSVRLRDFETNSDKLVIHKRTECLGKSDNKLFFSSHYGLFSASKEPEKYEVFDFVDEKISFISSKDLPTNISQPERTNDIPEDFFLKDEVKKEVENTFVFYYEFLVSPNKQRVAFAKEVIYGPGDLFVLSSE